MDEVSWRRVPPDPRRWRRGVLGVLLGLGVGSAGDAQLSPTPGSGAGELAPVGRSAVPLGPPPGGTQGVGEFVGDNLGDLVSDALLWSGSRAAGDGTPIVALYPQLHLGAGTAEAGPLDETDLAHFIPNPQPLHTLELPRDQLVALLEGAVAPEVKGTRRLHVAGMRYAWDGQRDNSRVVEVMLDDGTPLVSNGRPIEGPPIKVVIPASLVGQVEDAAARAVGLGLFDREALRIYIAEGLGGIVTAIRYPPRGDGRSLRLDP